MGVPAPPDYAKLRRDADRLVMLISDPHPDLATWEVVLESVMSRLIEVAPTPVLSRELLRRHPQNLPPAVGSKPDDLPVQVEPSDPDDPTSVRIAAEVNAWLLDNQPGIRRLLQEAIAREFSRWLAGKDDGSSPNHPPAVGSEPSKENGS
jgi:hypothetical protein